MIIDDSGPVRVLTLDRPTVMNAVNDALGAELEIAVDEFEARDDLRVMVVTGAGGNFCTGLDLTAFAATGSVPRGRRGFGG
ncbi:enoyl-CoA hydratase-related protein [Frondihabitans sucicola]|uniref:enoyl-CoA hydratase-related protein n=1 Tax=Frondihabitans sucicola TaxID=1268041 RepID=UPI002572959D|nr:enoyl-CoA hydratase-related protein [Frondihabitans sucicola]